MFVLKLLFVDLLSLFFGKYGRKCRRELHADLAKWDAVNDAFDACFFQDVQRGNRLLFGTDYDKEFERALSRRVSVPSL
jgi:hypothetical protein